MYLGILFLTRRPSERRPINIPLEESTPTSLEGEPFRMFQRLVKRYHFRFGSEYPEFESQVSDIK